MGRTASPVRAGDAFGLAVAVCDAPGRAAMNTFRCSACGTERRTTASAIDGEIVHGKTRGCSLCARREGLPPGGTLPASHDRRVKPVVVGERFGDMEAVRALPSRSARGTFRCVVCKAKKKATANAINVGMAHNPNSRGCARCTRRKFPPPTRAIAVNVGDTVGTMTALTGAPIRTAKVRWRCTTCKTEREIAYVQLVAQHKNNKACLVCNPRPKLSAETLAENRRRGVRDQQARNLEKMRSAAKGRKIGAGYLVSGTACDHEKELICVDPGGVEIRRCPLCQPVEVPAWTAPRAGCLFPRKALDDHDGEDDPGFENAVRVLEDL